MTVRGQRWPSSFAEGLCLTKIFFSLSRPFVAKL
jgi:hypothetical protein